jgi:hypothetical protein
LDSSKSQKSVVREERETLKMGSRMLAPEENKLLNKSSTTKKIGYEVQRVLKEDYENQRLMMDHKKYVKEKIESLKNKNSGVVERGKRY